MALLQIRDLPATVHARLKLRAERERRSLAQEAVTILARGLGDEDAERRRRVLDDAVARPVGLPKGMARPDVLIRADRRR